MFWQSRNVTTCREWLKKGCALDSDYGDLWIYHYKLEIIHGSLQQQAAVIQAARDAQPTFGYLWKQVFDHPLNASNLFEKNLTIAADLIDPLDIFANVSIIYSPPE